MAIYIGTPNGKKSITDIYIGGADNKPKRPSAAYVGGADSLPRQVYTREFFESYTFTIDGVEYNGDTRYETWGQWLNSKYNTDFEYHEDSGWTIYKKNYEGVIYDNDRRVDKGLSMESLIEQWIGLARISCIIQTDNNTYDRIFEISGQYYNPVWPNTIASSENGITYNGVLLRRGTYEQPGFKINYLGTSEMAVVANNQIAKDYFTINGISYDAFEYSTWYNLVDNQKIIINSQDSEQIMCQMEGFVAPVVFGKYGDNSYKQYIGRYDSIEPGAYHTPYIDIVNSGPLGDKLYVPNCEGTWGDISHYKYNIHDIAINQEDRALGFYDEHMRGYYFTVYEGDYLVYNNTEYYDGQQYYLNQIY